MGSSGLAIAVVKTVNYSCEIKGHRDFHSTPFAAVTSLEVE